MTQNIRPEVQSLIDRGRVQIDEISKLDCTREESTALIPALTATALANRIERTVVHTPQWSSSSAQYRVKSWMPEVCRRLNDEPSQMPNFDNQMIASSLQSALANYPSPADPTVANSYIEALYFLAQNAAMRLEGGL